MSLFDRFSDKCTAYSFLDVYLITDVVCNVINAVNKIRSNFQLKHPGRCECFVELYPAVVYRRLCYSRSLSRGRSRAFLSATMQPTFASLQWHFDIFHAISCGHAVARLKARGRGRKRGLKEALFSRGKDEPLISSPPREIRESTFVMKNGASSTQWVPEVSRAFLLSKKKPCNRNRTW